MIGSRLVFAAGLVVLVALSTGDPSSLQQRSPPVGTAVVTGQVVDAADGRPVPFARIEMRASTAMGTAQRGDAHADEDGRFAVERLAAGKYFVAAVKPGYAVTYYAPSKSTTVAPGEGLTIAGDEQVKPLELRLVRGAVITGHVTDAFGRPAAGAQIHIRQTVGSGGQSPFYFSGLQGQFRANSAGEFRLFGLAPGEYLVAAEAAAHSEELRLGATDAPRVNHARVFYPGTTDAAEAHAVAVRAGEERAGIDILLRLEPLVSISGTLALAANVRSTEITMALRPVSGESSRYISVYRRADGRFEAERVIPNRYWLTAYGYEQGAAPAERGVLLWGVLQVEVTDRDITGLAMALQPSSTVAGILSDEAGGQLTGYTVSAMAIARVVDAPSRLGRPDDSGRFVIRDLTPGRYRIRIGTGQNGNTAVAAVTATLGGQPLPAGEFEIGAGASLGGLVLRVGK
jgi:hypothetical protein